MCDTDETGRGRRPDPRTFYTSRCLRDERTVERHRMDVREDVQEKTCSNQAREDKTSITNELWKNDAEAEK